MRPRSSSDIRSEPQPRAEKILDVGLQDLTPLHARLIGQDHFPSGARVLIVIMGLDGHVFTKSHG